ncbi:MAG: hypothetical protein JOZ68_01905 [Acidimicrobiia bacterium]|nr:hypothetical protein [Acidimicrobiia bacterium]MBV9039727.1 hypothetical protein [Acidimicrobiia bacterium]MBV9283084.1 hypothetical protein [Acidimicrobiia bacterium]
MATADPATDLPIITSETEKKSRPEMPDPALFWKWVGRATRPTYGWILVGLGLLAVLIGYLGVSREAIVAKQLPYLISGGIGGLALVGFGAMLIGTEDLKRTQERVDHLEDLVADLHQALLSRPDAPALSSNGSSAADRTETQQAVNLVALPSGSSYHRADCSMVQGKKDAKPVTANAARRQGLKPCRLCEPQTASVSA